MNIRKKFLLTPAIVLTLMLILGIAGFAGLRSSNNSLNDIYNFRFQNFKNSSNALQNLGSAHADVYRLFTWLSNYDEAKIKLASNEIHKRIDVAILDINHLDENSEFSEEGEKKLSIIKVEMLKYKKQVANAIEMAQVDPNLGITSMQSADRLYLELQKNTESLVGEEDTSAKASYDRSVTAYKISISIFVTLMIIAFAAGNFMSFYMSNMIINPLKEAINFAQRIAMGNLQGNIIITQKDETGDLLKALADMQDKLREIIGNMTQNAHELTQMSSSLTDSSGIIVKGTSEQHDSASSMAASIEEMSVSINVVSENAYDADIAVAESAKLSFQGREVLNKMSSAMNKISTSVNESAQIVENLGKDSERISDIVKVIKDIAEQTNLLALNAAIEAARAGELGRGFAVVADEVRKLAERTTKSTQEIADMILGIQSNTQSAVLSMKEGVNVVSMGDAMTTEANDAMTEVERKSRTVSEMVSQISSALKEQGIASHEIASHVEKIALMAENNSSASKGAADSAQRMSALANNMETMVSQFSV